MNSRTGPPCDEDPERNDWHFPVSSAHSSPDEENGYVENR